MMTTTFKVLVLGLLISFFACSHSGRQIASSPPQYSFKLYSVTKYLPRTTMIFKRNYTYQGQISITLNRPLVAKETLSCTTSSFAPNNQMSTQIYPILNTTSIPLKPELNTVICEIINPVQNIELLVTYQPALIEEYEKIEAMLSVVKITDQLNRSMEPDSDLCADQQVAGKKSFSVAGKLITGKVGEFCGPAVEIQTGIFAAACDGGAEAPWNGSIFIFNSQMQLIKKINLPSPKHGEEGFEWTYSVDHNTAPLVVNKSAIFTTNDGHVIGVNAQGQKVIDLKLPDLYLSNPVIVAGTTDIFALISSSESSDADKKELVIIKGNQLIKTIDLSTYNGISSFNVMSDTILLVTELGEIFKLDYDGKILAKIQIEKKSLTPLLVTEDKILVGSNSGRLYQIDRELKESKVIYRAAYDGKTDFDVGRNESYAMKPNFEFAPIILKNGKIVIASSNDGRVHFLNSNGKLEKIVSVPVVRTLLNFGAFSTMNGEEFIATSSISYLEILSDQGDIVAESIFTGAEIFTLPLRIASGQFMMGMYNGIFRFKLGAIPEQTVTTKFVRPCH